ncbi:hypothetical protein [Streptacidiphilus rugosus]|uniref:hypothetical protein n=1 Tax=Streptacidiphilus rugosus TaxID=405783 RepID=UPI0018DEA2C8|nr:hypothetical protein [Streptacidiphilus rugosus]
MDMLPLSAPPSTSRLLPPAPRHLREAEILVDHLTQTPWSLKRNRYRHYRRFDGEPDTVRWGFPGRPDTYYALSQCGSFLTRVLERVYGAAVGGWATREFLLEHVFDPMDLDRPRVCPNAREMRRAFTRDVPHLRPVQRPADLQPGDLVAMDYRDPNSPYTGHVVMVRRHHGIVQESRTTGFGTPTIAHLLEIVDCTSSPHGSPGNDAVLFQAYPDSRVSFRVGAAGEPLDVDHHDGVGYGYMVVYADIDTGGFAGYRRSLDAPEAKSAGAQPIAAARPTP